MVTNGDEIKGRAKEAAGAITDNKKFKSEGKADRIAGEMKSKVKKVDVKVEKLVDKVKDSRRKK
jgi:uncharacterized protein YjbJ (UPF0337 family)